MLQQSKLHVLSKNLSIDSLRKVPNGLSKIPMGKPVWINLFLIINSNINMLSQRKQYISELTQLSV